MISKWIQKSGKNGILKTFGPLRKDFKFKDLEMNLAFFWCPPKDLIQFFFCCLKRRSNLKIEGGFMAISNKFRKAQKVENLGNATNYNQQSLKGCHRSAQNCIIGR